MKQSFNEDISVYQKVKATYPNKDTNTGLSNVFEEASTFAEEEEAYNKIAKVQENTRLAAEIHRQNQQNTAAQTTKNTTVVVSQGGQNLATDTDDAGNEYLLFPKGVQKEMGKIAFKAKLIKTKGYYVFAFTKGFLEDLAALKEQVADATDFLRLGELVKNDSTGETVKIIKERGFPASFANYVQAVNQVQITKIKISVPENCESWVNSTHIQLKDISISKKTGEGEIIDLGDFNENPNGFNGQVIVNRNFVLNKHRIGLLRFPSTEDITADEITANVDIHYLTAK